MTFEAQAVKLIDKLLAAIPEWKVLDGCACAGNGGEESGGFKSLQEIAPPAREGVGGFGWFQWTFARRTQFLNWCKVKGLDPRSDDANIGFVIQELTTTYKHVVTAVAAATTLTAKVSAFERIFEVPANPAASLAIRVEYARRALAEYQRVHSLPALPAEDPALPVQKPIPNVALHGTIGTATAAVSTAVAKTAGVHNPVWIVAIAVGVFVAYLVIATLLRKKPA